MYGNIRDGVLGTVKRLSKNTKPTSHKLTISSYSVLGKYEIRTEFLGLYLSYQALTIG